ncbi:hypothetical protein ACFL1X_09970 [Candidatus Hydrogenedentota bacterium]
MQMRAGKRSVHRAAIATSLVVLLCPVAAHAEPGASTSHIPMLWSVAVVGAVLSAMVPLLIWKIVKPRRAAWTYWLAAALIALLFLLFIGPVIVALGSILITGRTM